MPWLLLARPRSPYSSRQFRRHLRRLTGFLESAQLFRISILLTVKFQLQIIGEVGGVQILTVVAMARTSDRWLFVISGFLITSQVYSEVKRNAFSLKGFYQRRINRIVPALVTVLLATVIVGAFILSPVDLIRLNVSALLSLMGVSNIYIWVKYGNYFAADASEAPLLHTWSLGNEEQFYLLWPLFIVLLYRFAPRYVLPVLAIGVVVAVGVSEYATGIFATAAYYLLPTHFFELMLGGLLGIYLHQPRLIGKLTAHGIALAGFLLIGYSLFALTPNSTFPGIKALIPCLGATLLILAGSGDTRSRLLTSRPMVFIGLISYSLYLWHWPLIAYLSYLEIPIDLPVGAMLIAVSIILAWLSWRYVEVALSTQRGDVAIFPTSALYGTAPNDACRLGVKKEGLDGIMIGDSFANHFTGMVDLLAKPNTLSIMDYTMDSCPPILGYTVDMSAVYAAHCAQRNERAFGLIEQNQSARAPYGADIHVKYPQVHFIDPDQVICPEGVCSPIIKGQLLYLDDSHLNEVGSRFIGRTLLDRGYSLLHDPVATPSTAGSEFDATVHL
ncbi:acyltransferase family protein [Pseudomonas sp. LB1P83]